MIFLFKFFFLIYLPFPTILVYRVARPPPGVGALAHAYGNP